MHDSSTFTRYLAALSRPKFSTPAQREVQQLVYAHTAASG